MTISTRSEATIQVFGVRVNMLQTSEVVDQIERWISERTGYHYVVASGMHGVMEARRDPEFKDIVNSADLFTTDGISLVLIGRRRGYPRQRRVCGSDLMWEFLKVAQENGHRVFFYGDTMQTLQKLKARIEESYPGINIVGTHSPPFRELTPEEEEDEVRIINEAKPDVVWVGLGLPKQERWMFQRRHQLDAAVAVGVGAAFKFHSGQVKRAPHWIGDAGFEWLWRLVQEPGRMWRRTLVDGPRFVFYLSLEYLDLKRSRAGK